MKRIINLAVYALIGVFVIGCKSDEFKYPDKLEGTWTIVKSERMAILTDGTIDKFEDLENVGVLEIFEASPPAETFKEFIMAYTNYLGDQVELNSLIYTDEESKRVFMSKILCDSPFECDIVWTVDKNEKKEQIWSVYGNEESFFYPPDRYDPSNDDLHLKWRITLKKK